MVDELALASVRLLTQMVLDPANFDDRDDLAHFREIARRLREAAAATLARVAADGSNGWATVDVICDARAHADSLCFLARVTLTDAGGDVALSFARQYGAIADPLAGDCAVVEDRRAVAANRWR